MRVLRLHERRRGDRVRGVHGGAAPRFARSASGLDGCRWIPSSSVAARHRSSTRAARRPGCDRAEHLRGGGGRRGDHGGESVEHERRARPSVARRGGQSDQHRRAEPRSRRVELPRPGARRGPRPGRRRRGARRRVRHRSTATSSTQCRVSATQGGGAPWRASSRPRQRTSPATS